MPLRLLRHSMQHSSAECCKGRKNKRHFCIGASGSRPLEPSAPPASGLHMVGPPGVTQAEWLGESWGASPGLTIACSRQGKPETLGLREIS